MIKVYPIVLKKVEAGFYVHVPDLDISTQGEDLADSIYMARDAIGLWGITEEDAGRNIPDPTNLDKVNHDPEDLITLVDVDFAEFRKKEDNRSVKKNCTLPAWLNIKAEEANINCSKVLQNALINELGIYNRKYEVSLRKIIDKFLKLNIETDFGVATEKGKFIVTLEPVFGCKLKIKKKEYNGSSLEECLAAAESYVDEIIRQMQ